MLWAELTEGPELGVRRSLRMLLSLSDLDLRGTVALVGRFQPGKVSTCDEFADEELFVQFKRR